MNQGDKVKIHYTGTLNDGTVFDSSEGKEPLEFTIGENQVIAGFENGVKDMKLNEEKTIKISAKDAYGEKNDKLIREIPRSKMPNEMNLEVGSRIILKSPTGQQVHGLIDKIEKDSIFIDFNHPLAGKELTFKIKVVAINRQPKDI